MDRSYQANTIGTPPTLSSGSETGYPTSGSKATGQLATVPGAYWFHMVTEELRNAILELNVTPDASDLNQLATALGKLLPLSGGTMTGQISFPNQSSISHIVTGSLSAMELASGGKGACIQLRNNNSVNEPSSFAISLVYGSTGATLHGDYKGSLIWAGKNVVRSVNGSLADANGDVVVDTKSFLVDYSTGVDVSTSTYTATYPCLFTTSTWGVETTVNGNRVAYGSNTNNVQIYLDVGDVVTGVGTSGSTTVYRLKGAK